MQDIIAFLAALPLECIVLSVALFFIYMIAIAPVFIGIIAQRRLNAERDKPAVPFTKMASFTTSKMIMTLSSSIIAVRLNAL